MPRRFTRFSQEGGFVRHWRIKFIFEITSVNYIITIDFRQEFSILYKET
jgi:hypothetical protein